MIRVTKFRIKHNGVYYGPGDVIKGLSPKEEKALLSANPGILEKVMEVQGQPATSQGSNKPNDKQENKTNDANENLSINFNPDEVIK